MSILDFKDELIEAQAAVDAAIAITKSSHYVTTYAPELLRAPGSKRIYLRLPCRRPARCSRNMNTLIGNLPIRCRVKELKRPASAPAPSVTSTGWPVRLLNT
jgi:hypothetical protein